MRILPTSLVIFCAISGLPTCPTTAFSQESSGEKSPFNIHNSGPKKQTAVGEWGEIEFHQIVLEPSDYYHKTSTDFLDWNKETIWRFATNDPAVVKKTLVDSGFSFELATQLTGPGFLSKNETLNLLEIIPPDEVVLDLEPSQRRNLYPLLMPRNTTSPFFQPFSLPVGGIDAVVHIPTGLPEAQLDRIRKVTYLDGRRPLLSDLNLLLGNAADDQERLRILKTICRETSLTVRLKLTAQSDAKKLSKYWESSGRNKEILPILESVIRTSGVDHLDITHLLPPTPRKLIHTYPSPRGEGMGDDLPDCFWTAFGFFSDVPPDRHLDFVGHIFNERYERAEKPLQFGDLVVFSKNNGTVWIHSCNYIAADLVFTKNGMSMGRPWVISPLQKVADGYLSDDGLTISFFRLKPEYRR